MTRQAAPRGRRIVLVAGTVAAAMTLPTGIAHAYLTTKGTGAGSATSGTISALTGLTATPSGTLIPGGTGALVVRVTNPNSLPVTVTTVSGNGSITATGALGTCTSPAVTLTTPTAGLPATIAPGATATITLTGAITMGTAAQSGCQGATFDVPVLLTGKTS